MAKITLAVTGSIAAYKAADLTSTLTKIGHQVSVLMSQAACDFISPLTLQVLSKNHVHTSLMDEKRPEVVNHIDLAKNTDLFLVAPATANTISQLAQGSAGNIITAVALALPETAKLLLAPAMNSQMYQHPLTSRNLEILKSIGYNEIQPKEGLLACGDYGPGALADVVDIVKAVEVQLNTTEL